MLLAEDIRRSILQSAMRGILTSQQDEDSSVEELLSAIEEEKKELIKNKLIKKSKVLLDYAEDEIPFEIPDTWRWVKLGNISTYGQTKEKISARNIRPDMWSLDLEDIEKGTGKIIALNKACDRNIAGEKVVFKQNDILYSKLRPYLLKILVAPDDGICTPELVPFRMYGSINHRYIMYVLKSPYVNYSVNAVTYGMKMPRVGTDTMLNLLIPLPPIEEQQRIVEKLDILMGEIEEYAIMEKGLIDIQTQFPSEMLKSMYQYAFSGRLTKRNSDDSSVEDILLALNIQNYDGEKPYDIPEEWEFVRLEDLVTYPIKRGKSPTYIKNSSVYVFAQKCNLKYGDISLAEAQFLDENTLSKYQEEDYMKDNDIVINSTGTGTLGRVKKFHIDVVPDGMTIVPDSHVTIVRLSDVIDIDYVYHFIKYNQPYLESKGVGSTKQKELKPDVIKDLLVPLPPIEEQKRIVERLEQILPLIDELK